MITLKVQKRNINDKDIAVEANKKADIKAVVYGPKFESTSISIPYAEFIKVYNEAGETGVISLDIEGSKVNALIHEISLHPVQNHVIHVDFYAPEAGKKINANIPLDFIGESEAVKAGNILVKVMHEVEVEALPENLPHDIKVDISKLATLQDDVTIADLIFPANVKSIMEADEVVASVVAPKEDEEESAPIDLSAIEVEKKGKKEEEETKE
jgi:large subunit ribosomal protein L25